MHSMRGRTCGAKGWECEAQRGRPPAHMFMHSAHHACSHAVLCSTRAPPPTRETINIGNCVRTVEPVLSGGYLPQIRSSRPSPSDPTIHHYMTVIPVERTFLSRSDR